MVSAPATTGASTWLTCHPHKKPGLAQIQQRQWEKRIGKDQVTSDPAGGPDHGKSCCREKNDGNESPVWKL